MGAANTETMNKRQAMRIALATEASYILFGASTDAVTELLSHTDVLKVTQAQKEMALRMLRRAGFDAPMQGDAIVAAVLGPVSAGGSSDA